jgi:hypothetical protein
MTLNADKPDLRCAHLRSCEEALLDPAVRRDRARVAALLSEDFEEFGSSGRVWSREAIIDSLATEVYQPPKMEDFKCGRVGEDVALITYRTVRTDSESGQHSATLRSSLWVREGDRWRIRFHQGTKTA